MIKDKFYFKPFLWYDNDRDTPNGKRYFIIGFGHNKNNKPEAIVIENYEPFMILLFPDGIRDTDCDIKAPSIFRTLKKLLSRDDHAPTSYTLEARQPLYYYTEKRQICMKIRFKSTDALRHCCNLVKKSPIIINDGEQIFMQIVPTELKISNIIKFHTERKIKQSEWIVVSNSTYNGIDHNNYTSLPEHKVSWQDITLASPEMIHELGVTYPSIFIFDGEMNSHKIKAMPNPTNVKDIIFMTGILFAKYNQAIKLYDIEEYCVVVTPLTEEQLGQIYGTKLIKISDKKYVVERDDKRIVRLMIFNDELLAIEFVEDLIIKLDPDGFLGHNSNGFDWNYYNKRKVRKMKTWKNISRINNFVVTMENLRWESSAYSNQNLYFPICPGRIAWDTLFMTKRDYRLDSYKLDFLGQYFMGIGKTDHSPQQIFDACQNPNPHTMIETIIYCMRDVWVTWGLFCHLHFELNYTQLSNIMGVPKFDLFSRGMGVRTRTQVYKKCFEKGYYLNSRNSVEKESMVGGFVFDQDAGTYEFVMIFDFSGLYPSVQRWKNLSHDTLVHPDDKSVPLEKYNVIEWEDKYGKHSNKFIKSEVKRGLLPAIQDELAEERNAEKRLMKNYPEGSTSYIIHDKTQNGLKTSMNSIYGGCGQSLGDLYCIEVASSITALARNLIQSAANHVITTYNAKIVYGDSVTGNTPILVKIGNDIQIKTIEELFHTSDLIINIDESTDKTYKYITNTKVWTNKEWTNIKNIMRHATNKRIFRIMTKTGYVEVTEDHSLLNDKEIEISPKDIVIGETRLLQYYINSMLKKEKHNNYSFSYTSQKEAAEKYLTMRHFGYNVGVQYIDGKYIVNTIDYNSTDENVVHTIKEIKYNSNIYVYDLTTENHHFQAGIGNIIVHNTDSIMIQVPGVTAHNILEIGHKIEKDLNTNVFEYPIKMEFERAFRIMYSLAKKLYAALTLDKNNPDALNEDNFYSKGLITSRRDRCLFIRRLYHDLLVMVLKMTDPYVILQHAIEEVERLLNGQVPLDDLVTIKKLGKDYKNPNVPLAIYARHLQEVGLIVQAGDRLDYVYVKHNEPAQGHHWEDTGLYKASLTDPDPNKRLELDYILYLESQVVTQLDQIFHTAFPKLFPVRFFDHLPKKLKHNYPHLVQQHVEQVPVHINNLIAEILEEYIIKGK